MHVRSLIKYIILWNQIGKRKKTVYFLYAIHGKTLNRAYYYYYYYMFVRIHVKWNRLRHDILYIYIYQYTSILYTNYIIVKTCWL